MSHRSESSLQWLEGVLANILGTALGLAAGLAAAIASLMRGIATMTLGGGSRQQEGRPLPHHSGGSTQ